MSLRHRDWSFNADSISLSIHCSPICKWGSGVQRASDTESGSITNGLTVFISHSLTLISLSLTCLLRPPANHAHNECDNDDYNYNGSLDDDSSVAGVPDVPGHSRRAEQAGPAQADTVHRGTRSPGPLPGTDGVLLHVHLPPAAPPGQDQPVARRGEHPQHLLLAVLPTPF